MGTSFSERLDTGLALHPRAARSSEFVLHGWTLPPPSPSPYTSTSSFAVLVVVLMPHYLWRALGYKSSSHTLPAQSSASFHVAAVVVAADAASMGLAPRSNSDPTCPMLKAARAHVGLRLSTRAPYRRCARRQSKLEIRKLSVHRR